MGDESKQWRSDMSDESKPRRGGGIARRAFLKAGGMAGVVAGVAGALGAFDAPRSVRADALRTVRIGWAEPAACHAPLGYAEHNGIFAKHGIKAELVNFLSNGDDLLTKYLASGKIDVGAGFLLGWLKPLDEGLDVKLISATHAGCTRLLASATGGVKKLEDLKGKTIAVAQLGGSAQQVFAVSLAKAGVNPETEITWKLFPDNLLSTAVQKGEADALAHLDPQTFGWIKHDHLVEIANTQTGVYADLSCCTIGASAAFLKSDKDLIRRVVEAIIETHEFTAEHPDQVAQYYFDTFKPPVTLEDLTELLGQLAYHHHPAGGALEREIANEIDDLKLIHVFRANADSKALAKKFSYNVFA
jgi:NitT/TauT family transport system substrate-binding protein